ncbi:YbaB/EbfC family nucleoid-associated protein [Micromonospora violae]|uniref:YbaB/EbfC family nucleoid-associated protein n=1 Tax=Micromonospora violae TaxID=1278207 RepID=UPI00244A4AC4|nr:YbaB/EbfC family nucleoid-associated protein [Micromonospora violae]
MYGQYQQLRSGLDTLQTRLTALRVTRRSADGQVIATVGAQGQVIEVELTSAIYRERDAGALGRKITETIRAASTAAAEATRDLVAESMPAGSGTMDFLKTGDYAALLGRADAVLGKGEAER